jgi:hypothetical protein
MADADPRRLERVLEAIDAANAADPVRIEHRGRLVAKEPMHAELMTDWVTRLAGTPSELELIAARGHHLRRWERPRSAYPEGRVGYLRWRRDAGRFHAEQVGALMRLHGYGEDEVARVGRLIRKEGLREDPEVQRHEDARCLVFLQTQLHATAERLGEEEMVEVLARTLPKMSASGVRAATALDLGPDGGRLLARAVERAAERAADRVDR